MAFESSGQAVFENVGQVTVPVRLSVANTNDVIVPYTVSSSSTASYPDDYDLVSSGFITISARSTIANLNFNVVSDTLKENDETVIITLGTPLSATGVGLGSPSVHTVTIIDEMPSIQFVTTDFSVDEGDPQSLVVAAVIKPSVAITTSVSVNTITPITFTNGITQSASPITDYIPITNQVLTFSPGQSVVTFTVQITNDTEIEPREAFGLTLSNPGPTGVKLGSQSTAQVVIVDDDPVPTGCSSLNSPEFTDLSGALQTPRDNQWLTVDCGHSLIVDLGSTPITTTGDSNYDFRYFEILHNGPTNIAMDWVVVQVAESQNGPWYTVLHWGDGIPDDNNDLRYYWKNTDPHEEDNMDIGDDSATYGVNIPRNGIGIDIDAKAPSGTYRYIRIFSPRSGSTNPADIDAIIPYYP